MSYGLNSERLGFAVGQSNGTAFRWSDFEGMSALGRAMPPRRWGVSADGSRVRRRQVSGLWR